MDKRIRVELEGEDVGVDRAVNEALKDALLHLVRNTVDHGIESPAERTAAGKDPEGCLRIRAFHVGGRVHVELSDDGRGIDPDRLAARAVAAGALSREAADALSPSSALQLMFLPGLSTKEAITTVSGRGRGHGRRARRPGPARSQHRGLIARSGEARSFASMSR